LSPFIAFITFVPYNVWVLRYLHALSSFFFYTLGVSFFVAYLLFRSGIWPVASALWLQVADLPFALCAILYGGLSFYLSLRPEGGSKALAWGVAIPLALVFCFLVVLNFWGAWPFVSEVHL
jgi:hypothetical protein